MGKVALALLVLCVGAITLTVEGARTHENFAARTVYTAKTAEVDKEVKTTDDKENTTTTIQGRYPNGYPGARHYYNPVTKEYELVNDTREEVGIPEAGRYVHGYYDEVQTKYSPDDTTPVTKSGTSTFAAVDDKDSKAGDTIHDRYPTGYPKSLTSSHTTSKGLSVEEPGPEGRYPNGYYGQAARYSGTTSQSSAQQFNGVSYTTHETSPNERYPKGYYPNSNYAGNTQSTSGAGLKPVTYAGSYVGNFQTQPYPGTGVPFVPTGVGCRTAFWASNVAKWPQFFTDKSTVADAFGTKATELFGGTTILQALTKYGSDPYNELLRTACTALFNSYTQGAYPLSHMKVVEKFSAALISKDAAKAQALAFETANVGSISAGNACV